MIFDNIKNKELYINLHPLFRAAFEFMESAGEKEPGTYEIDGKNIYAMVQEYVGKEPNEKFEAHKKYIDVQYIISGKENMEVTAKNMCQPMSDYNEEKDAQYYTCHGLKTKIQAGEGDFAVFYPEDVHKPGIKLNDGTIKKVVVKILL